MSTAFGLVEGIAGAVVVLIVATVLIVVASKSRKDHGE